MTRAPVLVIAEVGVNHNGSVALARRMIRAAARAGADVAKFQAFRPGRLVVAGAPKAAYQARNSGRRESQDVMLRRLELVPAQHRTLRAECRANGVDYMASPFDEESLRHVVRLRVRRLKLGSGEITNGPLLLAAARTRLPLILSTGMASLGEIEQALAVVAYGRRGGERRPSPKALSRVLSGRGVWADLQSSVTLLHCTTMYPAPFGDANLRAIDTLRRSFGLPVGYSDHTPGIAVALAAVALGATVIEKHFTIDRALPGPDQAASLEPAEFSALVRGVREIEQSLGDGRKSCALSELPNRDVARKSLRAAGRIRAGERLTERNVTAKRPGTGRSPMETWALLGARAPRDFEPDEPL